MKIDEKLLKTGKEIKIIFKGDSFVKIDNSITRIHETGSVLDM